MHQVLSSSFLKLLNRIFALLNSALNNSKRFIITELAVWFSAFCNQFVGKCCHEPSHHRKSDGILCFHCLFYLARNLFVYRHIILIMTKFYLSELCFSSPLEVHYRLRMVMRRVFL